MSRNRLVLDFEVDFKFWALIPAVNLNFHSAFEIEWLCFGIYIKAEDV